jgi:hypothetical protein
MLTSANRIFTLKTKKTGDAEGVPCRFLNFEYLFSHYSFRYTVQASDESYFIKPFWAYHS